MKITHYLVEINNAQQSYPTFKVNFAVWTLTAAAAINYVLGKISLTLSDFKDALAVGRHITAMAYSLIVNFFIDI